MNETEHSHHPSERPNAEQMGLAWEEAAHWTPAGEQWSEEYPGVRVVRTGADRLQFTVTDETAPDEIRGREFELIADDTYAGAPESSVPTAQEAAVLTAYLVLKRHEIAFGEGVYE